jgi:hypothetical protein
MSDNELERFIMTWDREGREHTEAAACSPPPRNTIFARIKVGGRSANSPGTWLRATLT